MAAYFSDFLVANYAVHLKFALRRYWAIRCHAEAMHAIALEANGLTW